MLVYSSRDLNLPSFTDSDFQADNDSRKSTSGSVFTLGDGAVVWRSLKQFKIVDSTIEVEYIPALGVAKETVWLKNFLSALEVFLEIDKVITLYCDNSSVVANLRSPRKHKR